MFSSNTLDQIILNDALLSAETEMKTELKCPQNVPDIPCVVSVIKRLYFKTLGSFSHFSDITFLYLRQLLWQWHSFQVINTQWHSPETWHPVPNERAPSLCIQLWPLPDWMFASVPGPAGLAGSLMTLSSWLIITRPEARHRDSPAGLWGEKQNRFVSSQVKTNIQVSLELSNNKDQTTARKQ